MNDTLEALEARRAGAGIIMVDTGRLSDLGSAHDTLVACGERHSVLLAFAGGVTLADLQAVSDLGADIVDLGRAIIDAPLWDLHMEVRP